MLLIAGVGGIAFMISKDLVSLVFFYGLVIAMINGTNPVIEKMATTSRFSYGKIRIWGTIGYATGSQIAGLILAVICEAPIILFCSTFMDKISNKKLLIIAFLLIITQYFCYSLISIVAIKILATFLAKHVAAMLFVMINLKVISTIVSPRYQITALALGATISKNLSTVIFQNISGFILDNYNFERMFLGLLMASIIGLIAVLFYKIPSGNDKKLFS